MRWKSRYYYVFHRIYSRGFERNVGKKPTTKNKGMNTIYTTARLGKWYIRYEKEKTLAVDDEEERLSNCKQ